MSSASILRKPKRLKVLAQFGNYDIEQIKVKKIKAQNNTGRREVWSGFRQTIQTAGKDVDSLREICNVFDSCFCGTADYPKGFERRNICQKVTNIIWKMIVF